MICKQCGEEISKDTIKCPYCGCPLNVDKQGDRGLQTMAEMDDELDKESNWEELYIEAKALDSATLRSEAQKENAAAQFVLAKKYLASRNQREKTEGFRILEMAEENLRKDLSNYNSTTREALGRLLYEKGEYLEQCYNREYRWNIDKDKIDDLGKKVFEAYLSAYEIDSKQVPGVVHCYEEGIGVDQDSHKAIRYKEEYAINRGIRERYEFAEDARARNELVRAIEWLQAALDANNADDHKALKHFIRIALANLNETDERGKTIDKQVELEQLKKLASSNNAEAAFYTAELIDDEIEKYRYYLSGINGQPNEFATRCKQVVLLIKESQREKEAIDLLKDSPHKNNVDREKLIEKVKVYLARSGYDEDIIIKEVRVRVAIAVINTKYDLNSDEKLFLKLKVNGDVEWIVVDSKNEFYTQTRLIKSVEGEHGEINHSNSYIDNDDSQVNYKATYVLNPIIGKIKSLKK